MTTTTQEQLEGLGTYRFGWSDSDAAGASARRGLSEEVVRDISARKNEPEWMLDMRLKGLKYYGRKPLPTWGADLSDIDFDNIKYFVRSTEKQAASWDELPADIKHLRQARHPRSGKAAAHRGRRGPVRVRGRLPQDQGRPGAEGCHFRGHRHGAQGAA